MAGKGKVNRTVKLPKQLFREVDDACAQYHRMLKTIALRADKPLYVVLYAAVKEYLKKAKAGGGNG